MSLGKYILDDKGNPVLEPDIYKWGKWMDSSERHVGDEKVGPYRISTVFLGLDHNWGGGPPVIWETMIFSSKDDELNQQQDRCSGSREQAEAMHKKMVKLVKEKYGNRNKTKTRKASRS